MLCCILPFGLHGEEEGTHTLIVAILILTKLVSELGDLSQYFDQQRIHRGMCSGATVDVEEGRPPSPKERAADQDQVRSTHFPETGLV